MTISSVQASSAAEAAAANQHEITCPAGTRLVEGWLGGLCLLLAGYAILGKGFAYVGIPPLFIGELTLLAGAYLFLRFGGWSYVLAQPPVWTLIGLALWGVVTTIPHLSTYGLDALRDAMIWGYATFALLVMGALLAEPSRLPRLIDGYHSFIPFYLLAIPFTYFVSLLELAPTWPWVDVAVVDVKVGDVLVHLAGVFAFWASGLSRPVRVRWILLLLGCVAVAGVASRGGLVAFVAACGICQLFRPFSRLLWSVLLVSVGGLLLLAAADVRFELPGKGREFSALQMVESLLSIVDNSGDQDLDSTKQWRINWWTDIVNYTWNGQYFWLGKGFGINLADADGYQGTQWEGQLRSPHNGHLTMLARSGVPGFVLWLIPQVLWMCLLLRDSVRSLNYGHRRWNSLFVFLLAYWAALTVRASFDVFLEGPVGGIWFWTIYGIGLSATVIYRYCPEILPEREDVDEDSAGS